MSIGRIYSLVLLTIFVRALAFGQDGPIDYSAKKTISTRMSEGVVELEDQVKINFGETSLTAGYAKIYLDKKLVVAKGLEDENGMMQQLPVFDDGGRTFYIEEITYNWESEKAKIKAVFTQEGTNFLNGQEVKKVDSNTLYMAGTGFTTCSHTEPHFQIKTGKSKVQVGERIITGPAHLEFFGIPTPLIIPYGFFPLNMEKPSISGLLMPNYQNSPTQGLGIVNGGWYFPINDRWDLSLRGDLYLRGSWALTAASNYKRRYKYSGNLNLNYRFVKNGIPLYEPFGLYSVTKNFSIKWRHQQDAKAHPTRKFNANVNLQNPNFFRNGVNPDDLLNGTLSTTNNTMTSSITFNQKLGKSNLTVSANHTQNNGTQSFTTNLPKASLNVPRFFPLKTNDGKNQWYDKLGVNYSSTAEGRVKGNLGTISGKLDTLGYYDFSDVLKEYGQNGIRHNANMSTSGKLLKYITFNPSANFTERWYFQKYDYTFSDSLQKAAVTDTLTGFNAVRDFGFNASFNTKIYGTFFFNKGPVKAVRHMITPRATVNYRPDFGDEYWGYYQQFTDTLGKDQYYNRYTGFIYGAPGRGNSGQISLDLDNNVEAKIRTYKDSVESDKKVKVLDRFNLNTSYNLAALDDFNWNYVRITGSSNFLKGKIRVNYQGQFDLYGYDSLGARTPTFAWAMGQGLAVHRTSQFGVSTQIKSAKKSRNAVTFEHRGGDFTSGDIDYLNYPEILTLRRDWNLRLNYDLRMLTQVRAEEEEGQGALFVHTYPSHALSISGSYKPTDNWSLTYKTGVDIADKSISFTSLNAVRDLHCWEMRITWVPFGATRSYLIGIQLKDQQFRQVKAQRRRTAIDF